MEIHKIDVEDDSASQRRSDQVLVLFNQRKVFSLMHPMMIQKTKLVTILINHSYVKLLIHI